MKIYRATSKTDTERRFRRRASAFANQRPGKTAVPYWRKVLDAFKEWGGLVTLFIAVLYTFPLGILDRMSSGEEKQIFQSRQVLADGSSMVIERILNVAKVTDPRSVEMLNNMYNTKFFNLVYSNRSLLESSKRFLRSSELATMAGLLNFSGLLHDSLSYYDAAIKKAKEEKIDYVNILRDKAQVLTMPGPTRNLPEVRAAYREVLKYFVDSDHPMAKRQYAIFLSELAYAEATIGDWKCAEILRSRADNELQLVRFTDPSVTMFYEFFTNNMNSVKPGSAQPAIGCEGSVPEFKQ